MLLPYINIAHGLHVIRRLLTDLAWEQFSERLGQNCVLYTSAVKFDTAVVILAEKYCLYSYSVCLGICVTPPIQLCYLPTVLRRW
jgi:hypothetical protein